MLSNAPQRKCDALNSAAKNPQSQVLIKKTTRQIDAIWRSCQPFSSIWTGLILIVMMGVVTSLMTIAYLFVLVSLNRFFSQSGLEVIATANSLTMGSVLACVCIYIYIPTSVLFCLFGKTRLVINCDTIRLTRSLFGVESPLAKRDRKRNISKLEITQSYQVVGMGKGRKVLVFPELILWVGEVEYRIDVDFTLSERDWVAQELSDWLRLPTCEKSLEIF